VSHCAVADLLQAAVAPPTPQPALNSCRHTARVHRSSALRCCRLACMLLAAAMSAADAQVCARAAAAPARRPAEAVKEWSGLQQMPVRRPPVAAHSPLQPLTPSPVRAEVALEEGAGRPAAQRRCAEPARSALLPASLGAKHTESLAGQGLLVSLRGSPGANGAAALARRRRRARRCMSSYRSCATRARAR